MTKLYLVKILGRMYSYERYVAAKNKEMAEAKAQKRFKFSVVKVMDEMGEVIL